jgi:serine O-acetyltransferase
VETVLRARRFANVRRDWARAYEHESGARIRKAIGCLASPGFQAVAVYRFGHWLLGQSKATRLIFDPAYFVLHLLVKAVWGIDIPRHCDIGPGLYIAHFGGIFLSPHTILGKNCNLSQDVSIGLSGKAGTAGVPTIGDDVFIAPGAKLFGRIKVGNDVKIGANAVIHRDVPQSAVVVVDPGFRIVSLKGNRARAKLPEAA